MPALTAEAAFPRNRRQVLLSALFVGAAVLYSWRIAAPFQTDGEAVLAQYGIYGRSYVRHGYRISGFAPLSVAGPFEGGRPLVSQIYSHRPPTVSLLVTLPFQFFGVRETALRLPIILAALATLALFLALAERLLGSPWGLVAAALFAIVPIYSYYAVTTVHPVFGLLGALLIFLAGLRWIERPDRRRLAELMGAVGVACWLDWPAYYGAGAMGLLLVLRGGPSRKAGILVWLTALAAFAAFLGYLWLLDPTGLYPLLHLRNSGTDQSGGTPSLLSYLRGEGRELAIHFTLPLLLLAAWGATRLRPRQDPAHAVILSLVLLGSDEVLFRNMAWWHDYITLPLAPVAVLTATLGLKSLAASRRGALLAAFLVVGFLLQTGLVLRKRLTFVGSNEVSIALADALSRRSSATECSLVRVNHDVHLRAFYADRAVRTYEEPQRRLSGLYVERPEDGVDDRELIRRLSSPGHGYRWFVTAEADEAAQRLAWIRNLRPRADFVDFVRRYFWLECAAEPTPLVAFLRSRFPSTTENGFLFFDLAAPREK